MNVINFLPGDYLERRSRRHANTLCLLIGGGSLLLIGAIVGVTLLRAAASLQKRLYTEHKYEQASKEIDRLRHLEDRKAGLLKKIELSSDLLERVPRSHLLARLANSLPEQTAIQTLSLAVKDVKVQLPAPENPGKKKSGPRSAREARRRTRTVKELQFVLSGFAETDSQVADYIAGLSADPLFDEVNLVFSEQFPYAEDTELRRFEIVFVLSDEAPKLLETPVDVGSPTVVQSKPARGET